MPSGAVRAQQLRTGTHIGLTLLSSPAMNPLERRQCHPGCVAVDCPPLRVHPPSAQEKLKYANPLLLQATAGELASLALGEAHTYTDYAQARRRDWPAPGSTTLASMQSLHAARAPELARGQLNTKPPSVLVLRATTWRRSSRR
jgi:hypothetical protein